MSSPSSARFTGRNTLKVDGKTLEGEHVLIAAGAQPARLPIWNDTVVAESDHTIVVEGDHYFPPESPRREFFVPSATTSLCAWKGEASYYTLQVHGKTNLDAAWYYKQTLPAAARIKGRVAFWHGVKIER